MSASSALRSLPESKLRWVPRDCSSNSLRVRLASIKNELCGVVPIPNDRTDWIGLTIANAMNMKRWSEEPALNDWLQTNRLNGFVKLAQSVNADDATTMALLGRMREAMVPGVMNLLKLSAEI